MSSSTVRRDQLIGPLGLILLTMLFGLAFYILTPSSVPGNLTDAKLSTGGWSRETILSLDELDMAYIKAKQGTGEIKDSDVVNVIVTLMQAGRIQDARKMLAQYPALKIDAQSRSLIDLELAAAESEDELAAALQQFEKKRHLQSIATLERAISFSERLEQPTLTRKLYLGLASRNDVDKDEVYLRCANFLAQRNMPTEAIACYSSALNATSDDVRAFEIRLGLLSLLPGHSAEQQALVDSLLNASDLNVQQWQTLAPALLAAERPDAAYRIYARLALSDKANASQWLSEAANWAQAANRLSDAAVFFDALARRHTGEQRNHYLEEVIRVLVSSGKANEAYSRIQSQLSSKALSTQEPQQLDEQLDRAIVLARQLGKTEQALEWNTQRLAMAPNDSQLLATQAELALAAADLPLAFEVAKRAVASSPDNIVNRESLARVSEWFGKPAFALDQWLWLSNQARQPDESARRQALREVVRLGQATFQSAHALKALRELTVLEKPTDDDVQQLVTLHTLEGLPQEATDALNDVLLLHGESPFVLRTLAMHQYTSKNYAGSLASWQRYRDAYGHSSEAVMYQMELLWRIDKTAQAAKVADELRGRTLLSQASDYQLRLMAEIAWQYRKPWLEQLVQPNLQTLEEYDMRTLYGRRSLESLQEQGSDSLALSEAVRLWQSTGQNYFALSAMQLAIKRGDQQTLDDFLPGHGATEALRADPDYWANLASMRLRKGDKAASRAAYAQAFKLDPEHVESIAGTLWMDIADADQAKLQDNLQRFSQVANDEPSLWQAMAVGYLELGAALTSVQWFERLLDQIDTDYGMLLTYADALEYAGRAADAERVRRYTLFELRPLLASGSREEQSLVLRQYAVLSARYGSSNENEVLVNSLVDDLKSTSYADPQEAIWREDVAISWLMSTQRHEQARIVMTNLHTARLQAPTWQRLALALKSRDTRAIEAIVQAKGPLSIGNHILALRQLGRDRQAYALAQQALQPGGSRVGVSPSERLLISQQYTSLRAELPSYVAASFNSRDVAGINATTQGISLRHSFIGFPVGVGLDVSRQQLSLQNFNYDGDEESADVALSLFFGNRFRHGRITAGVMTSDEGDQSYANTRWVFKSDNEKRRYSAEAAYRELPTNSGELFLGARQNRATASFEAGLGVLPYVRVQADATQINTRVSDERFADGFAAQAELGVRGQYAGNNWTANVLAGHTKYQRSDTLPEELRLRDSSTVDSVLQAVARRVSVGASLSRGTANGRFSRSGTARYFVNTRLGHSWPSREFGLSADAGAGIRVLGGDELSFSLSHDTQGVSKNRGAFTSFGINYQYHF